MRQVDGFRAAAAEDEIDDGLPIRDGGERAAQLQRRSGSAARRGADGDETAVARERPGSARTRSFSSIGHRTALPGRADTAAIWRTPRMLEQLSRLRSQPVFAFEVVPGLIVVQQLRRAR